MRRPSGVHTGALASQIGSSLQRTRTLAGSPPVASTVQTEQGACSEQRSNAIVCPSGDQSGWSSTKPAAGCVICFSPVPSGLTVNTAPCVCASSR